MGQSCTGICQPCPANCNNGCHARFNDIESIGCGRKDEWDHVAADLEKVGEVLAEAFGCLATGDSDGNGCGGEIMNNIGSVG